jgi:predicted phage baseplate assembly protein
VLGSGNASQAFQRFELKQLPLTYRSASNEIGAAAELTVRIGDIAWSEEATLFAATPTEQAYTVGSDEQGRTIVTFGDGVRGARLPSGGNNVRATYRKGLGLAGNVAADRLTQLMTQPLGLKGVSNPLAAEGGTDPGTPDEARDRIPLDTRTIGRAVSLLDYEDFARAFSGVAKARAQLLQLSAGTTVGITIAGPDGALLTSESPVALNLLAALFASGDPHVRVLLLPCELVTFRVGLTVKRDPAYEAETVLAAVESALRASYAFDARSLAQAVQQSEVIAVAQRVAGVVAVDLTRLYGGTEPQSQTVAGAPQERLLASDMRVVGGTAFGAQLMTLDAAPFDQLEEMP